jgi:hypothetical protein
MVGPSLVSVISKKRNSISSLPKIWMTVSSISQILSFLQSLKRALLLKPKYVSAKFNRSHHFTEFPPGSYVMVKDMEASSSLDAPYDGPFKVVRRITHGTYVLRDTMNSLFARNYAPEQLKLAVHL